MMQHGQQQRRGAPVRPSEQAFYKGTFRGMAAKFNTPVGAQEMGEALLFCTRFLKPNLCHPLERCKRLGHKGGYAGPELRARLHTAPNVQGPDT